MKYDSWILRTLSRASTDNSHYSGPVLEMSFFFVEDSDFERYKTLRFDYDECRKISKSHGTFQVYDTQYYEWIPLFNMVFDEGHIDYWTFIKYLLDDVGDFNKEWTYEHGVKRERGLYGQQMNSSIFVLGIKKELKEQILQIKMRWQ